MTNSQEVIDPSANRIIHGDCTVLLPRVPTESVHLVLSDIPYGIGLGAWDVLHENTNSALLGSSPAQKEGGALFKRRGKPINGWSSADRDIPRQYSEWCESWAEEWLRILKPGASAFVFAGRRYAPRCVVALEDAGFNFRDMLAWVKPNAAHRAQRLSVVYSRRGDDVSAKKWEGWRLGNLRPTFEPILWFFKPYGYTIADNVLEHGVGAFNQTALERHFGKTDNVLECGMESNEGGLHEAQKPVRLMEALIEIATLQGQAVLDPFAGSGTSLVAARNLKRRYLGFEADHAAYDVAQERLSGVRQERLV